MKVTHCREVYIDFSPVRTGTHNLPGNYFGKKNNGTNECNVVKLADSLFPVLLRPSVSHSQQVKNEWCLESGFDCRNITRLFRTMFLKNKAIEDN